MIRNQKKFDVEFDLLQSKIFLPLNANPSLLQKWTEKLKPGAWVFIDEIQKIPSLMDEVHSLYESRKLNFALSGSSVRKLKRSGANMLAGRALLHQLYPITFAEYQNQYSIKEAIDWGTLPKTIVDPTYRRDYLSTYVEVYLRQELTEEGIIRKLEPFSRFLQTLGVYNGQILNIENIARESFVGRTTVDKYFEIIEDTLIGFRLLSFQPKFNKGENKHPKFYLFDPGVARCCAGFLEDEVENSWRGFSFESLIINEVRAYNQYLKKNRSLYYYKYRNGYEIDLIIENKKKTLSSPRKITAIEIKLSRKWDQRWSLPLKDLKSKSRGQVEEVIGVYCGPDKIQDNEVTVYPVEEFLLKLSKGEFF